MLKKIIIFIILPAALIFLAFFVRPAPVRHLGAYINKIIELDQINYFYTGEEITYDVRLGGLYLGKSKLKNLPREESGSRRADVMSFETRITKFSDRELIYSDPRTLLPFKVERKISSWPTSEEITETYDQKNFTLTIKKIKGKRVIESVIKRDAPIYNAVIFPFFFRGVPELNIGSIFSLNLPNEKFDLKLVSVEEIKVPAGKLKAYYFSSNPKKFEIWVSADSRRVPLKIKGLGSFGYTLVMKEYKER